MKSNNKALTALARKAGGLSTEVGSNCQVGYSRPKPTSMQSPNRCRDSLNVAADN